MATSLYSDGRTGQRRDVNLEFGADGIRFLDASGILITFWSYDGLNVIGSVSRAAPFQLCHSRCGEASLTSDDHTILQTLKNICPQIDAKMSYPVIRKLQHLLALVFAAAAFVGLFIVSINLLAQPIANIIPVKWEVALGNQISKRLVEETGICSATPGVKALQHLSNRIASVVSLQAPLRIQITDDLRINSFAVSGGSIVVFRGMLDEAKNSEEFAGLLAHEVSHNAERHALEGMIRSLGLSFIISSYIEDLSTLAFSSAAFKDTMVRLKYTPANEAVADALSVQILEAAKISPQGLPELFGRLRKDGSGAAAFFSRHETAGTGIVINNLVKDASGPGLSKDEWAALKNICSEKITPHPAK